MAYLGTVCRGFILLLILSNFLTISGATSTRESRDTHEHDHDDEHEHEHNHDDFVEIGNYLLEAELAELREEFDFSHNPEQNISYSQVLSLVEIVFGRIDCEHRVDNCTKCQNDFTEDVFSTMGIDVDHGFDEATFLHASSILLYGTYEMVSVCHAGPGGTDLTESVVMTSLMTTAPDSSNATLGEADLEVILDTIKQNYTATTMATCFNVESVFEENVADHETGADDHETHHIAQVVINGLLHGHCIGEPSMPSTAAFTEYIFGIYGTSGVIPEEEFIHIMMDLGIGEHAGHDHDHDHDHARRRRDIVAADDHDHDHPGHDHDHDHTRKRREAMAADDHDHDHPGHDHDHDHTRKRREAMATDDHDHDHPGHDHDHDHTRKRREAMATDDHDHDHPGHDHDHDHTRKRREAMAADDHDHDHPGHDHDHDHTRRRRDVMSTGSKRRSIKKRATVLADDGHNHDDHDHDHHNHSHVPDVATTCFSSEELLDIYGIDHEAGLTQEQFNALSPSLVQQILSGACAETTVTEPSEIPIAQVWGYGTLAVLIISLFSVFGGLFVPCMSDSVYDKTIQTMIALAVATLTGDAILHLLPQAVGLHSHDHSEEEGAHKPTSPEMAYIWKCLVVEMALYVFFVFEQTTTFLGVFGHSHNHAVGDMEMTINGQRRRSLSTRNSFIKNGSPAVNGKAFTEPTITESKTDLANHEEKLHEAVEIPTAETNCCIEGCNPVAMMIILGDALHNFGDGLAIGAAFTLSLAAGLSTSVAVLCHELPHELGDLAVLIKQGMRLRTALLLNLLCACTAFLGLWVGIPLGQTDVAREWIFAAVAGMFLYVGLVDMLPILLNYEGKSSKGTVAILQNIGFLLGIGIILVIALYEDSISFAL